MNNNIENKTNDPKNLFHFFFVNRIFAWILILILIVTGFFTYGSLVKEYMPDIKIPQAVITTEWAGASPELIEKEITVEIEKKIKSLEGLKSFYSGSSNSFSVIAVKFYDDIPINTAMQHLQEKINEAEAEFPKKAEKPRVEKVSINDIPIIRAMLIGNASYKKLDYISKKIKRKLEKIKGIKKVVLSGKRAEIIKIQLFPERLRMLGISPTLVNNILRRYKNDMPIGRFENKNSNFFLKLTGSLKDIDIIRQLPIKRITGHVIRLEEIAKVTRSLDREHTIAMLSSNGDPFESVFSLSVLKIPGQDTVNLATLVKNELTKLQKKRDWPKNIKCEIVSDESKLIFENLNKSFNNAWQSFLIVFIILFLMLSWKEAIIASMSIPLTLLGAISVIWLLGYSFNVMVIIGVILALGLLVDDFILMMEGMHENFYIKKYNFAKSAMMTIKHYAIPSLSGSLTTIMVFIPLALIPGVNGKFLRLIPVTTSICLILSYIISILVAVPLSGILLKDKKKKKEIKEKEISLVDRISHYIENKVYLALKNNILVNRWYAFNFRVLLKMGF